MDNEKPLINLDTIIEAPKKKNNEIPHYRKPVLPDHELIVWEKWIQIRKEETTKLGKRLRRPPVDLTMNLLEKVRADKERKTALEYSQIKKKPATIRGTLFERPPRLRQRCYYDPEYEIHRTPAELGKPRVIEHIGVPTYIQQTEKGLTGVPQRKECSQLNADYEKYRDKREKVLSEYITKIDPYRASTSKLMIHGRKPEPPLPKIPTPPSVVVNAPAGYPEDALCGVYAVKINKTILYKGPPDMASTRLSIFENIKDQENCTSWTYYFNVPVKRVGRSKIFLQNLGTVTLRYCWKKIKRPIPFIPGSMYDPVFFFNKNEDVLSPGQSKEICFTFVADKPGIYFEFWELNFSNICFFDTINEKLVVNLYADSTEHMENMKQKVDNLKVKINRKAISVLAIEVLNEILDTVFADVPQIYPYKKYFLEAELFVMKNPVCFYHQTEVAKMKDTFIEMAPDQTWDLSIGKWREVMMSKEYDDRMKYFEELKKSHHECLKPWYEGDELLKEKYRAVNDLLGQLANKMDEEYDRLTNLFIPQPELSATSQITHSLVDFSVVKVDDLVQQKIYNMFFIHTYDHVATTIELCAGILSSLDSNRWIAFDFCRS
ncbi:uncharacterized protein LOC142973909 [Anticarsia gemmatalis]|uniref:uncharacterized protein LOC142973909 n=1 Tax=Anticarsia gemmatalis TaxID=129554 RepID=UPI003F75B3EF